jgi:hypothetical protein
VITSSCIGSCCALAGGVEGAYHHGVNASVNLLDALNVLL